MNGNYLTVLGLFLLVCSSINSMNKIIPVAQEDINDNLRLTNSDDIISNKKEQRVGLEEYKESVPNAVPIVARQSKFDTFFQTLANNCPKNYIEGIYYTGPVLLLWLGGNAFCPSCIALLKPQSLYTAAPVLCVIFAVWLFAAKKVLNPSPLQTLSLNINMIKTMALINKLLGTSPTIHKNILDCIPKNDPTYDYEGIKEFVSLLSEEHFVTLPSPYTMLFIFENPRNFITKQEQFIDAICRHDLERVPQRIACITRLLEEETPYNTLPHAQAYKKFINHLPEHIFAHLPHKQLIDIAQYRPHLLNKYPKFLEEAQKYKVDDTTIITFFVKALTLSQESEAKDLAS